MEVQVHRMHRVELSPMFTFARPNERQLWTKLNKRAFCLQTCQTPFRKIDEERRKTYLVLENVLKTVHPTRKWHIRYTVLVDLRVNKLTHHAILAAIPFVSKRQQLNTGLAVFVSFEREYTSVVCCASHSLSFSRCFSVVNESILVSSAALLSPPPDPQRRVRQMNRNQGHICWESSTIKCSFFSW